MTPPTAATTAESSQNDTQTATTVARFIVIGPHVPTVVATLPFAEHLRAALIRLSDGAPVFTGKQPSGDLLSGHRHCYVLPEANGEDLRITHLTLYAPMGFDDCALAAMRQLSSVWCGKEGQAQLALQGAGIPAHFCGFNRTAGQSALLACSRTWRSITPFVNTRHAKRPRATG